ncbi:hypothetical protein GA0070616_0256 [Micromonospora nigra]|uniref:Uncharacterized protein n=1 Tax=Micromonospora nigra TaxID=145857 RepID=A0A1C6R9Q4_9ACTN|nr:hypothetical protein [Micromonospora nigra]SCL13850.1 hypothetical protein GA0070616_0256 [Micromonospora nigra]
MRTTPRHRRLARLLVPVAALALAGVAVGGGPARFSASGSGGQTVGEPLVGVTPPIYYMGTCGPTTKKPDLWDELFPACPQGDGPQTRD